MFHGYFDTLDPNELVNEQTGYYTRIDDLQTVGRAVTVVAESGYFGEQGQTIDVRTHRTAHSRTPDQSATTMARLGFVLPPEGQTGVFCIERAGRSGAGPKLIELFRHALMPVFRTYSWSVETVIESAAWMAASELEEVRAVVYTVPTDIARGVLPEGRPLGRVEQALMPEKGNKFLPHALWDALRNGSIKAGEFLSFDGRDVDETTVVVSKNGHRKRFNIEREKTPAVRTVLSEQRDQPITDIEFVRRCQDEARDYFQEMRLTWQEQWRDGGWTTQALQVTIPAR